MADFKKQLQTAAQKGDSEGVIEAFNTASEQGSLDAFNDAVVNLLKSDPPANPLEGVALGILPGIVNKAADGAADAITLMGLISQHSNPREVILVNGGIIKSLLAGMDSDDDDDAPEGGPVLEKLKLLIESYTSAAPRLQVRKATPARTIQPILDDIRHVWETELAESRTDLTQALFKAYLELIEACYSWGVKEKPDDSPDRKELTDRLVENLQSILSGSANQLGASLSLLAEERCYPETLAPWRRQPPSPSVSSGRELLGRCLNLVHTLGFDRQEIVFRTSSRDLPCLSASLVLLATDLDAVPTPEELDTSVVAVVTAFATGIAIDAALAWLVHCTFASIGQLKEEKTLILIQALTKVASLNQDPLLRQVAFHTLSVLVESTQGLVQMEILSDLLTKCPYAQMRVSAIGLLKTVTLNGIQSVAWSPFASSELVPLLRLVLAPNPGDVLSEDATLSSLVESRESARLLEGLGLYYVLLRRDNENKTTIKDSANVEATRQALLRPLRDCVDRWNIDDLDEDEAVTVFSLNMALERVEETLEQLQG